ncbi:MAG: UDP-N-acetylglucosamine 2-epimerase (non-hydrolyzing) [Acidobacteriia bacterium]|nr:UDP-N-acetylglucosamine 2-epimerase (non-hydrolyzing) [Terriglobia bacterium]
MKKQFRLVSLLGIRPDIIRMGKLLNLLERGQAANGYRHLYVHSGQHYDDSLEGIFHRELGVRRPKFNMGTGRTLKKRAKTGHVYQAGYLFEKTAQMIERLRPDAVLFLGDTNTVLSSIVVAKHNIPVIHVEGGGRSFDWRMPEEKNRIIIDHLSDVIYCYLDRYKQILLAEGVAGHRVVSVGNIIVDALEKFLPAARQRPILRSLGLQPGKYALCTLHREENIENRQILEEKVNGLRQLSRQLPVVFPVMPRVRARLRKYGFTDRLKSPGIILTPPLGFLDFLKLEAEAKMIVTDSGTVQEEALLLGVPCLVTRRSTERPETIAAGASILAEGDLFSNAQRVLQMERHWDRTVLNPLGGSPSERIYEDLLNRIRSGYFAESRCLAMLQENSFVREAYGLTQRSFKRPLPFSEEALCAR